MPTVLLSPIFNGWQGFTPNGLPMASGNLYSYAAGTSTPLATYTTSSGSVANSNPILLGADGRPPQEIWLVSGSAYKFVLADSLGNVIGTYDNIIGYIPSGPFTSANGLTMNSGKLLGRTSTGSGSAEEITVGSGLTLTGLTLAANAGVSLSANNTWTGLDIFNGPQADVPFPSGTVSTGAKITRTSSSGGTGGGSDVRSALFIGSNAAAGTLNYEWAQLNQLDNYSAFGENVAFYGKGYKHANGPTWSAVLESKDYSCGKFTGSISGTVLTVSSIYYGGQSAIQVGMHITGPGVLPYTIITSMGTGTGGVGTYNLSTSQTYASGTLWTAGVIYGLEIDVWADGYDGSELRRGIGFNFGNNQGSDSCQIAYGIDFAPNGGNLTKASLGVGLNFQINCDLALIQVSNLATMPALIDIASAGAIGSLIHLPSSNSIYSTSSLGAYQGKVKVKVDGGTYYIPVYA